MKKLLIISLLIFTGHLCKAQKDTIYYIVEDYYYWDIDTNKIFQSTNEFPMNQIDHSKTAKVRGQWVFYNSSNQVIGSQVCKYLYSFPVLEYYVLNTDTFNLNKTNWNSTNFDIDFDPNFMISPVDVAVMIDNNNRFKGYSFAPGIIKHVYPKIYLSHEIQYGKYQEGNKVGEWSIFSSSGRLYKLLTFEDGQLLKVELYNEQGDLKKKAVRENDTFKLEIMHIKTGELLDTKIIKENLIFYIEVL